MSLWLCIWKAFVFLLSLTQSLNINLSLNPIVCWQSNEHKEERSKAPERKRERRQLKTKRLKEYTIKSHSSMPPNNTYINFERFAQVEEDVSAMEGTFCHLASAHDSLQEDIDALLSIYNEKEMWYKEESESIRHDLSQLRYEFRKVEAQRRGIHEDMRSVDASVSRVSERYKERADSLWGLAKGAVCWAAVGTGSGGFVPGHLPKLYL